jgi:hypothetical protein
MNEIYRFAFKTYPNGHRFFQDLDGLLTQKDKFLEFIQFEYFTSIIYNTLISLSCLFYFISRSLIIFPFDLISSTWILLVSLIKLFEILPKIVILIQTIRIAKESNDPITISRRLMLLTRSNIFFFNTILGYLNLFLYSIYFLLFRTSKNCEQAPQFYMIIKFMIYGFFLRLIISFVNYFLHFKFDKNEADFEEGTNFYKDFKYKLSDEVLKLIESIELNSENIDQYVSINEENERDFCSICMLNFEIGDKVKLLPCNKKHIFHNNCIDKWLSNNQNCPNCRKEINKKILARNKFC